MAVRHGYGKVAGTDALVFAYDTGDTRNSYKGESTTNQFTNPDFSNGTTGWTFGSWDGGRYTYTTETVIGPFGKPVTALKIVRTTSDTSYAHFHQGNGGKFTNSNTYTISAYVKGTGTLNQNTQGGYSPITYNPGQSITLTGGWQRISYTLTSQTDSLYPYWAAEGITQNVPMYFTLAQSEVKSHFTPFVNGTRSSTQGLLDLTGNQSVNISTVSFDSNAQITFDGTDDTLSTGIPLTNFPALSNFSIECIAKIDSYPTAASPNFYNNTTKCGVLVGAAYYSGTALYWYGNSSGTACTIYAYIRGADAYRTAGGYDLTPGRYHHLVLVNDYTGGTLKLYANGILNGSANGPTQQYNPSLTGNAGNIGISKAQVDGGGEAVYSYFQGNVPAVKLYSKALSADEVRNNYSLYKTRFNM